MHKSTTPRRLLGFSLLFVLMFLPNALLSATGLPGNLTTATRIETGMDGAFVRTEMTDGTGSLTVDRSTGEVLLGSPTVQWTIDDDGLLYIPTEVALGGRGAMAFYGCYLNNERTRLFSTTTSSATEAPVWEDTGIFEAWSYVHVDAAENSNVLTALAQFPIEGDITNREVIVYKYTSDSGTPDWTYTFPNQINANALVAISEDGAYIAAVLYDEEKETTEIAYFESESSTPLFTDSFASTFIRALDMTDDGSLLYINEGTMVHIYDVDSQTTIFSVDAGASFDSHTLSGDGTRFAFGGFGFVRCYEWDGSTYQQQFDYNMSGSVYCARCDLSADASTLAAAFYNYSTGLDFRVVSIDATTGDVNFEEDFTGTGGNQNTPYDIETSADGSRIVYGGWGDEGNTNPEVMVFEGSGTPVATIDTRGSVFGVDISADGIYVASGSKSIHANESGNGGDHSCLYMGGQDLYLDGVPALGTTLTFMVEGSPGERVLLAASLNEVNIELPFGTLIVDPDRYLELGRGVIDGSGVLSLDFFIPDNQVILGRKVATQALFTGAGARLSNGQVFWILP